MVCVKFVHQILLFKTINVMYVRMVSKLYPTNVWIVRRDVTVRTAYVLIVHRANTITSPDWGTALIVKIVNLVPFVGVVFMKRRRAV